MPAAPAPDAAEVNYEGLATVRSRNFEVAQVRPGTDFGTYSRVVLESPTLAYSTPHRKTLEFPLTQQQKDRFRDALTAAFDKELAGLETLRVVDAAGPGTLSVNVRVRDIVVSVAPRAIGRTGRAAALLEASANAVVIVELSDSQSNTILARGVNRGSSRGAAVRQDRDGITTRFDSTGEVVAHWAAIARAALEALVTSGN